jgi:hypothetical protein
MPARVDDAKSRQIKPYRQAPEPADGFLMIGGTHLDLTKKLRVLARVFICMRPQESPAIVAGRITNGIEFVISHHRTGGTGFTHRTNRPQHLPLLGAAVDEIAYENYTPRRMSKDTLDVGIAKPLQQAVQGVGVPVNVADKIVSLFDQRFSSMPRRRPSLDNHLQPLFADRSRHDSVIWIMRGNEASRPRPMRSTSPAI